MFNARSRNQRRHKCSSHVVGVGLFHVLASEGLFEKEVRITQQKAGRVNSAPLTIEMLHTRAHPDFSQL
jgi:hypothetical protein